MEKTLQEKCELFLENRDILETCFRLELTSNISAGAIIYAQEGKKIERDKIRGCYEILKGQASAFSDYRSVLCIPLIVKMSLYERPLDYLNKVIEISKKIKVNQKGFILDVANIISAMVINESIKDEYLDKTIERSHNIFKHIKKGHPILTSDDDRTDAVILAMSKKSDEELIIDMEECYKLLKSKIIGSKSGIQALSHVLALSEKSAQEKCNKIMTIYELLKQNRIKFELGTDYALTMLGAFTDIEMDNERIVNSITDIFEYLQKQKGLGKLSISKAERFVYSAIIFLAKLEETNMTLNTKIITELAVYTTLHVLLRYGSYYNVR